MQYHEREKWVAKLRHATDPTIVLGSESIGRALDVNQYMWQLIMHTTRKGIRKEGDDHPVFKAMEKPKGNVGHPEPHDPSEQQGRRRQAQEARQMGVQM